MAGIRWLRIATLLVAAGSQAVAQDSTRAIQLDVVGRGGTRSLDAAVVVIRTAADGQSVQTGTTTAGQLLVLRVPLVRLAIETRAVGFAPDTTWFDAGRSGGSTLRIELESVTALEGVDVVAAATRGRLAEFDRRRATGKGTFITSDEIARKGQTRLADLLRGVRGLRVDCRATCYVRMIRSTNCEPRIFLDGFPSDSHALFTPILDVGGIEVYHGPSETPGEFIGSTSMCGVIVIWTKAGPPRGD